MARQVAERMLPGIARVRAQTAPFAQAWQAANAEALRGGGPLWVALGDSMSQGIGAQSIDGGWVRQLHARLRLAGSPLRVVNLSVTGARLRDVIDRQAPRVAELGDAVALVTVLAGANDMFPRDRRQHAPAAMAELLDVLPPGRIVVATLPRRNQAALDVNAVLDAAAGRGVIAIADLRGMTVRSLIGTRAADLFHPNERGYAALAGTFADAIPTHLRGNVAS
jgi:acyl-CoA thioesterase-1